MTFAQVDGSWPMNPTVGQIYYASNMAMAFVWDGKTWLQYSQEELEDHWFQWLLFLDDEREPEDVNWQSGKAGIHVARTSEEAKQLVIERGLPHVMSLDHDLGGDDTAFTFMWWLINGHLDEKWNLRKIHKVQVHSANPEGVKKLMSLWENFCRTQGLDSPITRVRALRKKQ